MESNVMTDVKGVRQSLAGAKEERMALVCKVGEETHKQLLINKVNVGPLQALSAQILEKDKTIYQLANQLMKLTVSQVNCPSCQQSIAPEVKFCGNCGTLNPLFQDAAIIKTPCSICDELIEEQFSYCPCCGSQQEER